MVLGACSSDAGPASGPQLSLSTALRASESDGQVEMRIRKTGGQAARLFFSTRGESAVAGQDFERTTGELSWAAEEGEKRIIVPLLDGPEPEPEERFFVDLSLLDGGRFVAETQSQALRTSPPDLPVSAGTISVRIAIEDDDAQGTTLSLRSATYEEDVDGARFIAQIVKSGAAASVRFAAAGGTAEPGVHFESIEGTASFSAVEDTQTFVVALIAQGRAEAEGRTIELMLFEPSEGATIEDAQLTLTIPPEGARPPVARFTASPSSGTAPLLVRLDASASEDPEGGALRYLWRLGDLGEAEGVETQLQLTAPGDYPVTLEVRDPQGLFATETQRISVQAARPASPTVVVEQDRVLLDSDGSGEELVRLDASASTSPQGGDLRISWMEGEQLLAQGPIFTESLSVGDYFLTVVAQSGEGGVGEANVLVSVAAPPSAPALPLRVNAAGGATQDAQGNLWTADQAYTATTTWGYVNPVDPDARFGVVDRREEEPGFDVLGTEDEAIFATERWGLERYVFQVPNGVYDLSLSFAETFLGVTGPDQRVFDVLVEGQVELPALDVYAQAGFGTALILPVNSVVVRDRKLDIVFGPLVQRPLINGIALSFSSPLWVANARTRVINDPSNDAQLSPGGTDLQSESLSLSQGSALRFRDLGVPQGATISGAYIQLTAAQAGTSFAQLEVAIERSDNAARLDEALSDRAFSNSPIVWRPSAWTEVGEAGAGQRSPNLAPLLQSVVDRPGWSSGAVVFRISGVGERSAVSHDRDPSAAPRLFVLYRDAG